VQPVPVQPATGWLLAAGCGWLGGWAAGLLPGAGGQLIWTLEQPAAAAGAGQLFPAHSDTVSCLQLNSKGLQ
jgi:hypothetical protein